MYVTASKTAAMNTGRWVLATFLFILTVINFMDRFVIATLAPILMHVFHLSIAQFGIFASAFGWGYTPTVFLSGAIVSALGPRRTYGWFVTLWSLVISAIAVASGFGMLIGLRVLLGVGEGTAFPAASQLIGKWFPKSERGRASGLLMVGIPLGSFLVVPLTVWLAHSYSWRAPFIALGVLGIVWVIVAMIIISDSPDTNLPDESSSETKATSIHVPWDRILRSRALWIAGFAFFSSAYVNYFMQTFFPTYLVRERHVEFTALALLGSLPFAAMTAGALFSGVMSDWLLRRFGNLQVARSYLTGTCMIVAGILVTIVPELNSTGSIIAVLCIASFVNFIANPLFITIAIDVAPDFGAAACALTTGLGGSAAIVAPLLTGFLVQASGTFVTAFAVVAALPIVFGLLLILACKPDLGIADTRLAT